MPSQQYAVQDVSGRSGRDQEYTYLYVSDVRQVQLNVPLHGEVHGWSIRLLVLNKANANNVAILVFEEESDALETTGVAGPPTRT